MAEEKVVSSDLPMFIREGRMYYTIANGSGEPTHVGQLKLRLGSETEASTEQANGVGPIDVMFKCLVAHAARRGLFSQGLQLARFILHAEEGGSEAPALVCIRLLHNGSQADGDAKSKDIFDAGLNALIAAANELLRTDPTARAPVSFPQD